jgi:copper transport protein
VVSRSSIAAGALAALLLALAAPQAAQAHAVLEGTSPGRGAQLVHAPDHVTFRFSEPVEVAFGAVRVYDSGGDRVDRGSAGHPEGRGNAVAIDLDAGLGDGRYTATYRVVSADSHPVAGGFVFTVGQAGTPAQTLDELIEAGGSGPVTETGFGIVRGLSYLALALGVGGIAFVASVWRPALRASAGPDDDWLAASESFADRARRVVLGAVGLGVAASALGIVFQGAIASGTSLWQALEPDVIGDVLATRFGTIWGLRLLAWLAVAGLLLLPAARLTAPVLRPAALGASGLATASPATAAGVAGLAALLAFLCLTPAFAGHASTTDPTWLLVPANFVHVLCVTVWVGGIGMLLAALPGATGRLEASERTQLLAAAVGRFSTVALFAVAGLVAAGTIQAIAELDALSDLTNTPFGRAILIKIVLLLALIGLGAWNRQRARPRLAALAARGGTPGATGAALRRSLRAELGLMAAVLGVTAALVSYAPASTPTGPFSTHQELGPARLELTVEPARAGRNQVHLYLFDRRTGRQYEKVRELTVAARLPDRSVGPLPLQPEKAGPGHYVIRRADLAPPGEWRVDLSARVSAFDAYNTRVDLPIR